MVIDVLSGIVKNVVLQKVNLLVRRWAISKWYAVSNGFNKDVKAIISGFQLFYEVVHDRLVIVS